MFSLGADEHELLRCLAKKKLQITAAGGRADNLPVHPDERARFVSGLQEAPMRHVRDWFYTNADFTDLPDTLIACGVLRNETETNKLDEAGRRRLWRAVLAAFVQQRHVPAVDAFLKGSVKDPSAQPMPPLKKVSISIKQPEALTRPQAIRLPGAQGKRAAAAEANPAARRALGVHGTADLPLSLDDVKIDDKSSLTVIGTRTATLHTGQFFIHISGIVLDGAVVYLSPEDAKRAFPETGDATAFPNTIHVSASAADSLSLWRVEHRSPDKKSQYVITEFLSHVYKVFDVPHSSGEADLVREWIREVYKPASGVFPVFRLSDGPVIKFAGDVTHTANADFDSALHGYKAPPTLKWSGGTIIIKQFPAPDFKYDCAPVRTTVKRLFRARAELSDLPVLTNRQITNLADAAANQDIATRQSVQRVQAQLSELFAVREQLENLMEDILRLPTVQESIGLEKERLSSAIREEATAAKAELVRLASEKKQLQAEIENLKQARKRESAAVSRAVKQAFDQAGADGLKALASISLFKNILGLAANPPAAPGPATNFLEDAPEGHTIPATTVSQAEPNWTRVSDQKQMSTVFARWYWHNGLSTRMLQSAVAAAAATGVVALVGDRREQAAAALVSTIGGGTQCTVSVTGDMFGVSDLMNAPAVVADADCIRAIPLGDFISQRQEAGVVSVVRLRGVNRAPPESLLPELLEAAAPHSLGSAISWTAKNGSIRLVTVKSPLVFLVDFAHGRSVFPFMPPLAWEVPLIDTDAPWGDYGDPEVPAAAPCAMADPEFFAQLASGAAGLSYPVADGMPRNAVQTARRMKAACQAIGLAGAASDLAGLVAIAQGREEAGKLASSIGAIGGELAQAFKAYTADADFGQIFDMGAAR
jgi:hypothetical protein